MHIASGGDHATDKAIFLYLHMGLKATGGLHLAITALLDVIARCFILRILAICAFVRTTLFRCNDTGIHNTDLPWLNQ